MEILRAEHLTKIYGKGNTSVTAVNDLSLSVAQGEFVAVVGSSGSGKSTLLHMLGGVAPKNRVPPIPLEKALTLFNQLFGFFVSRATLKSHSVASAMSCSIIKSLL